MLFIYFDVVLLESENDLCYSVNFCIMTKLDMFMDTHIFTNAAKGIIIRNNRMFHPEFI